jgi:hypothetical protein
VKYLKKTVSKYGEEGKFLVDLGYFLLLSETSIAILNI